MHIPVLQKEVLDYLNPKPNENFIDCTIGGGGHTTAILRRNGPGGRLLGIEIDSEICKRLEEQMAEFLISLNSKGITRSEATGSNTQFPKRLILVNDSYANLKAIVKKYNFGPVHGILLDLGMSSWHLEESGRGFTFLKEEPLDMRYTTKSQNSNLKSQNHLTAETLINECPEEEIEKILGEYGEEKFAKRIAKEIIKSRKIKPIETTFQLNEAIKRAVPLRYQHKRIHPSTRTFQALRIAVNDELNNLKKVLPQIIEVLSPGGRIVIISFHSLEDRIVKNFFKEKNQFIKILTRKPITAAEQEIKINPRSRSAKLRAALYPYGSGSSR